MPLRPSSLVIRRSVIAWSLVLGSWSFASGPWSSAADLTSPLSPEDAQKAMVLADASLRIELAAAEPDVIDPVAIRFDEDGRMWVVQMSDYPLGNPSGGAPLSKIRVLEDRDGDGRFETATTFAEKLLFITGLQPWKGGVFVTRSGKLTYMKDTDGDGRADVDELWFEGFAEQNSQLRANHPRLALDNWIYVANGLRGGVVFNRKLGDDKPINISGMDFRFDPLTGKCEAVSGNGQFGLAFDDWGNRFICSNRNPVKHVVIEDRYLKANPGVTVPATVHDVAAHGEASRIFPISRAWTTSNLHAGQFTAACGVYIYRGDLLPAEFKGNAFTCDPTGNLIHREIMQPAGPTFTSKPAYEGKEFLASKDEWFRPVNMELGPDGALYVVDMYRCVIEHPDFVPEELKKRPDLRLGDDRGRIWRIVPTSLPLGDPGEDVSNRRRPSLSNCDDGKLISLLEHANAWQRETAQRLLLDRESESLPDRLKSIISNDSAKSMAKSHALWTLQGRGQLDRFRLVSSMKGSVSHLRRQGLLIREVYSPPETTNLALQKEMAAMWSENVNKLCDDEDAIVRFQARMTKSITSQADSRVMVAFQPVSKDVGDPWMRQSLRFYLRPANANWLIRSLASDANPGRIRVPDFELELQLIEDLSDLLARDKEHALPSGLLFAWLIDRPAPDQGLAALRGAAKVWQRSGLPDDFRPSVVPENRLMEIAQDPESKERDKTTAVMLLGFGPNAITNLTQLAGKEQDHALRIASLVALSRQKGIKPWTEMIETFSSNTPPIRRAIIDGLLSNAERTNLLLDAIEKGHIKASEIDLAQVKRLTAHRDAKIKERANKLLAAATPADRAKALADYQPVLQMKGDAHKGQAIFEKNCSACHRIAGIGTTVAPDISDSRTKKYDQLLADILQPNRAIDNNYLGYTVRTLGGEVLTGILTAETATSITLRQQGGKDAVIPRAEIDELKSSGVSLMPEGLERNIPPQEMADLLAFIKNWRYLDGLTPLAQ